MTVPDPAGASSADDRLEIVAGPLRLVFRWEGDRWSHSLEIHRRRLASTVEWDALLGEPTRVVSPAFQQLTHQGDSEKSEALLVGQWGAHHFSGVFRVTRAPAKVTLEVDVAVRSRGGLDALAATYRVHLPSGALLEAGPSGVSWRLDDPAGVLRLEPGGPEPRTSRLALAEAGRLETTVQVEIPLRESAATRRLAYRWEWSEPSPTTIL